MSHVAFATLLSPHGCTQTSTLGRAFPLATESMESSAGVVKATKQPLSTASMRARLQFIFPPVFIDCLSAQKIGMLHRAIVQRLRDRRLDHVSSEQRDMLQQSLHRATVAHNASRDSRCGRRFIPFDEVVTESDLCNIVYLAFACFDRRRGGSTL